MGTMVQGEVLALTGNALLAVQTINSGLSALRLTGATAYTSWALSYLATAYADLGRFHTAWRCIDEALTAVETTKERVFEAEIYRIAAEITLKIAEV